ncbi:5-deoxy-glucuronate isomerase [Streptomyces canus]|uniref:5-deoxy-glucuronate isomerase n=1 Tax=Streptomyces canus TaxID=58343 RepID=UPI000B25ED7F|nr:5-deoxy-glucuronate isomerase [Streptomyces canus]
MRDTSKYHLPKGTSADGPDLAITPESAGWAYSGLRILTLRPGGEHALSTGENEFLVLPLTGGCTVAVDGQGFVLGGRTDVFSAVSDFAYLPRESQAVISSADRGTYALPCARTEQGGHSARYGHKEDVPVELRGAGALKGSFSVSFVGSTPITHPRDGHRGGQTRPSPGGAKNHAVVLPDADLEFAANHLTAGAYGSADERCMAVAVLEHKTREINVGPGDRPVTDMRSPPAQPSPPSN